MSRSKEEIKSLITKALSETAPDIDASQLDFNCSFREQYEIDSVDLTNFFTRVEKAAGVRIENEALPKLKSLNALTDYLVSHGA